MYTSFIIIFVVVVILIIKGIYIVQQQTEAIIERLGRFHTVTGAGLHVMIPFFDRIAKRVDLRTRQLSFQITAKSKDNVTIDMDIAAQYHVDTKRGATWADSGTYRSFYSLSDPIFQMQAYLTDALRSAVPGYDLDEVFDKKDSIAADVNQTVSDMMESYGYILVSTLITNIGLPTDVEASMNKINSAQREKVAAQSLAEAERIKIVTEAKAAAEAMEEAGKGIAAQRTAIAEGIAQSLEVIQRAGVSVEEADALFLATQHYDALQEFAKSGTASTVILPSHFREETGVFEQIVTARNTGK